jgi:hypothetical protein
LVSEEHTSDSKVSISSEKEFVNTKASSLALESSDGGKLISEHDENESLQIADASVDMFYNRTKHEIQLNIRSILNKHEMPIYDVNLFINIFYCKNERKSFCSNERIKIIFPFSEEKYIECFVMKLKNTMSLEDIDVYIFITGKFQDNSTSQAVNLAQFCINGKDFEEANILT